MDLIKNYLFIELFDENDLDDNQKTFIDLYKSSE